jgi:hypothetical protein
MLSSSYPKGKGQENAPKSAPVKKREDPCMIKREDFDVCMKTKSIDDSCFHVMDEYLKCVGNYPKKH